MLLTDEQYVIKWLSQYGPLPKAQVVRLLRDKSPTTAERLLSSTCPACCSIERKT